MTLDFRTMHRRLAGPSGFPIFAIAKVAGIVGDPFTQPLPIGPLLARRNNSFALIFLSGINNVDAYTPADAPSGWTPISSTGSQGFSVYSKAGIKGSISEDITFGGGLGDVWVAEAIMAMFSVNHNTLVQNQFGGASPIGIGTNSYSISNPVVIGNTGVLAINISSQTGVNRNSFGVSNVHDNLGNKYTPLASITEGSPPLDFNQNFQMFIFYCRGMKGGTATIDYDVDGGGLGAPEPASGSPWFGEFEFH